MKNSVTEIIRLWEDGREEELTIKEKKILQIALRQRGYKGVVE